MNQYFLKTYEPFRGDNDVKVDLCNYATKADLKIATGIDTSKLAEKSDLASIKAKVHKLDIEKLIPVPVDLSKLNDVVKNDIVKKTVYDKLLTKVKNINTGGFRLKTKYETDKSELEKKIPDTSGLIENTGYNSKIIEIENKIPSISDLATNAALTVIKNKIPNINSLVKKIDYNTKINEIEKKLTDHNQDKYITTPEFNKLTTENFAARLEKQI